MNRQRPLHTAPARKEGGFALFVALIILVMLTLVGIAMLGNNGLQTKMAYSSGEAILSFQSADSALAAGENWLTRQDARPIADCVSPCATSGLIWRRHGEATPPVPADSDALRSDTWWDNNGRQIGFNYSEGGATPVAVAGADITGTSSVPLYIIEYAGADNSGSVALTSNPTYKLYYYLVSARGYGAGSDSRTVVQSVYAKGY